jgi:hypothetical protein
MGRSEQAHRNEQARNMDCDYTSNAICTRSRNTGTQVMRVVHLDGNGSTIQLVLCSFQHTAEFTPTHEHFNVICMVLRKGSIDRSSPIGHRQNSSRNR